VIPIDVLIVGGGLQGLVLLDEFATSGRSCVLVTQSELGHGQPFTRMACSTRALALQGPRCGRRVTK
jgi:2-polyprenyl-6-methoxyphenol hydroxylase-like FAD-dependent oxidoreductase